MVDLSIVVPIYNEEKNIKILYNEIKLVLNNLKKTHEIIFINDGSTDNSEKIMNTIKDNNFRKINFRKNFGQTAALDAGFKASKGNVIITLDGDLQNDPKDIHKLLIILDKGYDIVAGWRANRKDSFSKKFISKGAKFLRRIILNDNLRDSGCTMRAYKKECIKELNLYGEMHRFIHIILSMKGFKIAQTKVNHRKRIHGITKYNSSRTVKSFLDMLLLKFWLKYSTRPIHLLGGTGLLSTGAGSLMLIYLIFIKLFFNAAIANRPLLLFAIFFIIIGFLFLMFGILADILIKIYYKDDTPYTIK
ncbi:glycosyltransferase family 2 protein [Candidatus Woesearchaeota archaeon]|jgi:glycosyltransferase involved in cell wall biosynthesis|nr:glycosyltransferase family 2 protein [Candidatus Woesearchaeota archaeon]